MKENYEPRKNEQTLGDIELTRDEDVQGRFSGITAEVATTPSSGELSSIEQTEVTEIIENLRQSFEKTQKEEGEVGFEFDNNPHYSSKLTEREIGLLREFGEHKEKAKAFNSQRTFLQKITLKGKITAQQILDNDIRLEEFKKHFDIEDAMLYASDPELRDFPSDAESLTYEIHECRSDGRPDRFVLEALSIAKEKNSPIIFRFQNYALFTKENVIIRPSDSEDLAVRKIKNAEAKAKYPKLFSNSLDKKTENGPG